MHSYEEFFSWCEVRGLITDREIAKAFGRTPQTVRNWKKNKSGKPPLHLNLACEGYDAAKKLGDSAHLQKLTMAWFDMWRSSNGLDTLESTGDAFGLTRQAVHNWKKRSRLPRWLQLACLGYEKRAEFEAQSQAA